MRNTQTSVLRHARQKTDGLTPYLVETAIVVSPTAPILGVCHCAYQHFVVPIFPKADIGNADIDKLSVLFKYRRPFKVVGVKGVKIETSLFAHGFQLLPALPFKSGVFGGLVATALELMVYVLLDFHNCVCFCCCTPITEWWVVYYL